ncbi:MAG: outer membrane beta-barrel protein [Bacteroidota bacterium]
MTRFTIYLCFLLYSFSTNAQFDYSIDFVTGVDRNEVSSGLSSGEYTPTYSYRTGINLNYKFTNHFFLKTGLRFAVLKTKHEIDNLRWSSEIGPNGWMPDPTLPRSIESIVNRRCIELPLHVRYQFGKGRLSGFTEIGISPHIYLNTQNVNSTNLETVVSTIDETEFGTRRFVNAFVFSVGVNYAITSKLQLFAQPVFRKYQEFIPNSPMEGAQTNFGLEFGIRRGFGFGGNEDI